LPIFLTAKLRKIIKSECLLLRGVGRRVRDETGTHSPGSSDVSPVATPSGPHSQHPWQCQKYDATPSFCLSLHRGQLGDPPAESSRSTADGLSKVQDLGSVVTPHLGDLSTTLGSAMVDLSPPRARALVVTARSLRSMADSHRPPGTYRSGRTLSATLVSAVDPPHSLNSSNLSPGLSTSPSLSTAMGGSVAAYASP
jgi:hypothetical protein